MVGLLDFTTYLPHKHGNISLRVSPKGTSSDLMTISLRHLSCAEHQAVKMQMPFLKSLYDSTRVLNRHLKDAKQTLQPLLYNTNEGRTASIVFVTNMGLRSTQILQTS